VHLFVMLIFRCDGKTHPGMYAALVSCRDFMNVSHTIFPCEGRPATPAIANAKQADGFSSLFQQTSDQNAVDRA
jgi:hypothetical protein